LAPGQHYASNEMEPVEPAFLRFSIRATHAGTKGDCDKRPVTPRYWPGRHAGYGLRLLPCRAPDVLDEHKQMPCVGRRWREAEVPVERDGALVLGVNGQRAHADHVGDVQCAAERIKQEPGTDAMALGFDMNGETREHQERDRMARHALDDALGSARMRNLAGDNRVEADNFVIAYGDVGL